MTTPTIRYLTARDVARFHGVATQTVDYWVRRHGLAHAAETMTGIRLYTPEAVAAFKRPCPGYRGHSRGSRRLEPAT